MRGSNSTKRGTNQNNGGGGGIPIRQDLVNQSQIVGNGSNILNS